MTDTKPNRLLDTDSATRKTFPMFSGLLAYFPDALAYVAFVSHAGNQKHNPGQPLHHARGKSTDHADCAMRHLTRHGEFDGEIRETGAAAWRLLALLQEELEQAHGFGLPRGARAPIDPERLAAATAQRLAHNADPTTRNGGIVTMIDPAAGVTKPYDLIVDY